LNHHKKETETELDELRKEITIYEQAPSGTFPDNDQFLQIMKPFLSYAEKKLADVSAALDSAITTFRTTIDYFGDDQKMVTPNSFFSNIVNFAHAFKRSHHLSMEKKFRLEMLKLKEQKRIEKAQRSAEGDTETVLTPIKVNQRSSMDIRPEINVKNSL